MGRRFSINGQLRFINERLANYESAASHTRTLPGSRPNYCCSAPSGLATESQVLRGCRRASSLKWGS